MDCHCNENYTSNILRKKGYGISKAAFTERNLFFSVVSAWTEPYRVSMMAGTAEKQRLLLKHTSRSVFFNGWGHNTLLNYSFWTVGNVTESIKKTFILLPNIKIGDYFTP